MIANQFITPFGHIRHAPDGHNPSHAPAGEDAEAIIRRMLGFDGRRVATFLVIIQALSVPLRAQTANIRSDRPIVVNVDFTLTRSGERDRELNVTRPLQLASGERLTIAAAPIDQNGRRFPLDRFRLDVDPAADCRGRVDVSASSSGELRVQAGSSRGSCRVAVWVPGNLNLEYTLNFEVGGLGVTNYSRQQAGDIVDRLYRAMLQRSVDEASSRTAIAEVQRGRLESQVESMIASSEFQQLRQQQSPVDLLTAFYQGLFDREPDSGGLRQYLGEVERSRYAQVIMSLVQSEEFERRLAR